MFQARLFPPPTLILKGFYMCAGGWAEVIMHAMHMLYHWAALPSLLGPFNVPQPHVYHGSQEVSKSHIIEHLFNKKMFSWEHTDKNQGGWEKYMGFFPNV